VETDRTRAIPPPTIVAVVDFCEVPQNFLYLAHILRHWRERCQHSGINPTAWKRRLETVDWKSLTISVYRKSAAVSARPSSAGGIALDEVNDRLYARGCELIWQRSRCVSRSFGEVIGD
jgi:hypothetical protein